MPSGPRRQLGTAIVVASAALGLAGVSHRANAGPQVLTDLRQIADQELPASALKGTGIAVVTHFRGSITGFVNYGAETWELMPGKAGAHVLYRVDDARLPRAEPEVEFPVSDDQDILSGSTETASDATTTVSGGYVHDLLVVYTPATSAAYGQATLERSGNGVNYAEIATLGTGVTSRVDNGVIASSNYYYRVRAYNSAGNSAYSNVATVTTPAAPCPRATPALTTFAATARIATRCGP